MIDPRSKSTERLVPPAPLPLVSRRALARVKDVVPIPCSCRYCEGEVKLVRNSEIYGREYGEWPFAYLCTSCKAYVGLHPATDLPLGYLADATLRKARNDSKALFHRLIIALGISRDEAYTRLAKSMSKDKSECHFGMFEVEDCALATRVLSKALKNSVLGTQV